MIGLEHYLIVAAALFVTGIFGIFLNRKNVIILLMSIELMLLSVNINLVAFSAYQGNLTGQVFTLFVLTVAAAEAAIGLAILVCFFRNRGTIDVEDVNVMKGYTRDGNDHPLCPVGWRPALRIRLAHHGGDCRAIGFDRTSVRRVRAELDRVSRV